MKESLVNGAQKNILRETDNSMQTTRLTQKLTKACPPRHSGLLIYTHTQTRPGLSITSDCININSDAGRVDCSGKFR